MSPFTYLTVVTTGSAGVGLWLLVRLPRLAPKSARAALFCFVAAWAVPNLALPFLDLTAQRMPLKLALFVSVFPTLTAFFALTAGVFRYLIDLLGHAAH